ncbi:PadR family transcriptional regulator [Nocardiopsis alba]|uniref:PadR family transcriptional regulator n=1 Tax=Nocardiopsis alba TaxID=53437 RepID=A0A7K2ILA9_9ACTN|nr:PadR family transcriptional regulator [Nocardiopsis alba]MYR30758.1 PadR family transcriptional regulator [Nocardiopsis alba]
MKMTVQVASVLRAFVDDVERRRYGFDLMEETSLKSGTVYPILARLEVAGWLISEREDIDEKSEGRRARRFYRLSPDGVSAARVALAELHAQLGMRESPLLGLRPLGEQA